MIFWAGENYHFMKQQKKKHACSKFEVDGMIVHDEDAEGIWMDCFNSLSKSRAEADHRLMYLKECSNEME